MGFSAKLECCKWLCKNGNIRLRRLQPNDLQVQQVLLFQSLDKTNMLACISLTLSELSALMSETGITGS